jgi:competence protein ComEC
LFPAAVVSWGCAWWATGAHGQVVLIAAGLMVGAAVILLLWLAIRVDRSRRDDHQRWIGAVALVLIAATAIVTTTGVRLLVRERDPLTSAAATGATVTFTGRVIGDPRQLKTTSLSGADRWALRVAVDEVTVRGRTTPSAEQLVALAGVPWGELGAGYRLRGSGKLVAARPGDREAAVAFPRRPPTVIDHGSWIWRSAERLRVGLRAACHGLPADAQGLLPALVVGDTSHLSSQLRDDLQASGLTHLTAVSGSNVAILAAVVVAVIAGLGGGLRLRVAGTALAICGFVVLARPEPSVLRAAVMGGLALIGLLLARRGAGVPMLAATSVVLLFFDPWLARSFGFVLSVLATAGLLLLVPLWLERPHRLPRPVVLALAVPVAAQLATGPVTVLLNPSISLVAVPANLLVETAVAPATVAGVLAAALSVIWPFGAHLVAVVGGLCTEWIALVAHRAAAIPGGSLAWPAGLTGALLLAGLTVVVVVLSRHRAWPVLAVCLLAVLGCVTAPRWVAVMTGAGRPPPDWVVVQCDVGQGSATLIRSGPDRAVIVDTGPDPALVDRCLRRTRVSQLDLMVITHFHADHAGGITGALRGRGSPPIIVSPLAEPSDQARKVGVAAARAQAREVAGTVGMTGECGAGSWAVHWRLFPPSRVPTVVADGDGTEINNASVVLFAEVQGLRVMALGDVETEAQQPLVRAVSAAGPALAPVDVVIVAHHGSARQEPRLYQVLHPRVALIGVGAGNDYGHPSPSALALLHRVGAAVFRTDQQGQLAVSGPAARLRVVTSM